jgi:hypothetical protein
MSEKDQEEIRLLIDIKKSRPKSDQIKRLKAYWDLLNDKNDK